MITIVIIILLTDWIMSMREVLCVKAKQTMYRADAEWCQVFIVQLRVTIGIIYYGLLRRQLLQFCQASTSPKPSQIAKIMHSDDRESATLVSVSYERDELIERKFTGKQTHYEPKELSQ